MNIYDVYKNPIGKIYADATGIDIMSAIVTAVEAGSKPETPQYFYFEAVEAGSTFQINNSYIDCVFEYSTDGKTWTDLGFNTITLENVGDRAYIRQSSDKGYWQASGSDDYKFNTTGNLKIGGYISTLAYNDASHDRPNMESTYSMSYIFLDCTAITDASDLKLDFVELTVGCYHSMFIGTSLTVAPELPATTLAPYCYEDMFFACSSLTTAPSILPATELADSCYDSMFSNCTSLTTAPELPATTLASSCYKRMFASCTSLTTVPSALPADMLIDNCYYAMFAGCTSLTTAPELYAIMLSYQCCGSMFNGCTNLNSITMYASDWDETSTIGWVNGVSPTGTFTCPAELDIPTGESGIPEGWTRVDL